MTNKTNKRRAGFYWLEETPYVSVTQVLKVIDKPALRWWFGREVFYALAKEPTLSEKEALAAPYKKSKTAMKRGTTVHEMVEQWKKGAKLPKEFEGTELAGYGNAFIAFLEDHPSFEPLENERTVVNKKERYAGTLDLLAKVGGKRMIIDIKTNKDANIYDEVALQLSAYREALGEDLPMYALSLGSNGQYAFKMQEDCYKEFLAAKTLWEWVNSKKLESVEFYREVNN